MIAYRPAKLSCHDTSFSQVQVTILCSESPSAGSETLFQTSAWAHRQRTGRPVPLKCHPISCACIKPPRRLHTQLLML